MITIGEQIKQARLEKNITLEEVSHRLRISLAYLKDIEQGRFDFLPKPYVIAFTKIFANFVGLNGEQIIAPLREKFAMPTRLPATVPAEPESQWLEQPPPVARRSRAAAPRNAPSEIFDRVPYAREIAISLGIILTIALLLYLVSRSGQSDSDDGFSGTAIESSTASQPAAPEVTLDQMVKQEQAYAKPDSTLEPQGLALEARINAQVWMRLIADGKDTVEATYTAGSTQTWQAKESFKLRAGNISALSLRLNGKNLENLGPSGKPANLMITREGVVPERPGGAYRTRRAAADTTRGQ